MAHALYDIFGPGLYIEAPAGDPNFMSQARMSLNILRSRPCGVALLRALSDATRATGNQTVIAKSPFSSAAYTDDISEGFLAQLRQPGTRHLVDAALPKTAQRGRGCSAIAYWSPSNRIMGSSEERPAYLPLAHELVHALHYMLGDCARPPENISEWQTKDCGLAEEEARTVGIGPYQYPAKALGPCENEFRAAFGMNPRTEYGAGQPLSGVSRTYA
jgi:hypothetical protein